MSKTELEKIRDSWKDPAFQRMDFQSQVSEERHASGVCVKGLSKRRSRKHVGRQSHVLRASQLYQASSSPQSHSLVLLPIHACEESVYFPQRSISPQDTKRRLFLFLIFPKSMSAIRAYQKEHCILETVLQPKNKLKKNCVSFLAQTHTFKPFFSNIESTKCFIFHSNLHGPSMKIGKANHFFAFTLPCSLLYYVFKNYLQMTL